MTVTGFALGDIISYREMCDAEGISLQHGMNFRDDQSVFLMSTRPGAPYPDEIDREAARITYMGHNMPRTKEGGDPKSVDQPMLLRGKTATRNKRFFDAARAFASGARMSPLLIRVYEKMKVGIWVYNGRFSLRDAEWTAIAPEKRKVFRFRLTLHESGFGDTRSTPLNVEHDRLIPSAVKMEVFKRDKGQCVLCGSTQNIHFDHDLPFSKGGSSSIAGNVRLLCAHHNLRKGARIE